MGICAKGGGMTETVNSHPGEAHCWHTVGKAIETHGPFAPERYVDKAVMGCCQCGRLETVDGTRMLPTHVVFTCATTGAKYA